ncbi:MAG TPA: replicative DNA helicase [Myxococcota bacterium]|nr:replicative DNA helicase [Myxococcota bacterium]HOH77462.1 replicative DNA helicase [Myxococcota bacterium]
MIPGDKPPPHSPEVEAALIGAALVNQQAFPLIAEQVAAEEFYDSRHQRIFEAMSKLFTATVVIDPVTVANSLKESRNLEAAGGTEYLAALVSLSVPLDGCEHYARIVRTSAALRRMIFTAAEITAEAYNGGYEPEEFLSMAEEKLLKAGEKRISKQVVRVGEMFPEALRQIEIRRANHTMAVGISSGYKSLDGLLTGFHNSDLIILAARPAMGKTSFALNLALNAAFNQNKAVLFVSLEMGMSQIVDRILCVKTGVDSKRLRRAQFLAAPDLNLIRKATVDMDQTPLYIDDTAKIGMLELRAKARRLKAMGQLDMIMVDYLQLMDPSDKRVSREQQISEISRNLKAMAKEMNIPVMALSQLSRAPETRPGDKRPMLSDLRESGAIEQDADVVMFLYRPEYYKRQIKSEKSVRRGKPEETDVATEDQNITNLLEVMVEKHRNGPTGVAKLCFIPESMSITDWTEINPGDYGVR